MSEIQINEIFPKEVMEKAEWFGCCEIVAYGMDNKELARKCVRLSLKVEIVEAPE